jgi:hypothetical protein
MAPTAAYISMARAGTVRATRQSVHRTATLCSHPALATKIERCDISNNRLFVSVGERHPPSAGLNLNLPWTLGAGSLPTSGPGDHATAGARHLVSWYGGGRRH